MKDVLKIAGAFIGFIVGAGFASGQELLQFFVSFGVWGLLGTILSSVVFIVMGMTLASYGSKLKATSHKQVVNEICGKWLCNPVDALMTFFMFAIAVVMVAGSGSLLQQQFGLPTTYGGVATILLTILATWLKPERVIGLISLITPLLIVVAAVIGFYAIFTKSSDLSTLSSIAQEQPKAASNWFLAALLYVSYNIFACVAILAIAGGSISSPKKAALGGLVGGLVLGALMFLISLAMLSKIGVAAQASMPMLSLASDISPALSLALSVVIILMIFNTAVGSLYSFSSRLITPNTPRFKVATLVFGIAAYAGSTLGFIKLVGLVYPFFGYIGFVLMASITWAWMKQRKANVSASTIMPE